MLQWRLVIFEECKLGVGGRGQAQPVVYAGEDDHIGHDEGTGCSLASLGNDCSLLLTMAAIGRVDPAIVRASWLVQPVT